jgi:hypothetical protein
VPGFAIKIADLTNAAPTGRWYAFQPGTCTVVVKGTFDSGTVAIQASDDNGTTVLSLGTNADFTANGARTIELGTDMQVRAVITGQGATADVDVLLRPLKGRAI